MGLNECDICGGTGVIVIPATEHRGRLVDEMEGTCVCVDNG